MPLQRAGREEAHLTDSAAERSVASVYKHVTLQRRRLSKFLLADAAAIRPLAGMDPPVLLQDAVLGKLLAADVADERPLGRRVAARVTLQRRLRVELRRALVTRELFLHTFDDSRRPTALVHRR